MQELRFVAVSEDGRYAVLAVPGRSARFTLPIDERLRAVALGQTSRLAQYEIEVESPLRPKEIQARIRAGETVEEIADAAGIAVERVRWFEGPVLAERAYIADQAQASSVRRPGESTPGPRLGEISAQRLTAVGADPDDVQWDARKRGDGNWQVLLTFTSGGRLHVAEWMFDPRRRHVIPVDDNAARMSLPDVELPAAPAPSHGQATVTRLEPRVRHEPPPPVFRPEPIAQAEPVPAEAPAMAAQPVAVPFTPAPASSPASVPSAPAAAVAPAAVTVAPAVTPAPVTAASPAPAEPEIQEPAVAKTVAAQTTIAEPAATATAPAVPAPAPAAPTVPAPAVPEPVFMAPAVTQPAPEPVVAAPSISEPSVSDPSIAAPVVTAPPAEPVVTAPAVTEPAAAPAAAAPAAEPVVTEPVVTEPAAVAAEPAVSQPAAVVTEPATPATTAPVSAAPASAASAAAVTPAAAPAVQEIPIHKIAVQEVAVHEVAAREPAANAEPQHDNQQAAAASKTAEPAGRQGRKNARGRRSSVPSWDEIMLGSSRQQD
jgi:DUF3071 family protein